MDCTVHRILQARILEWVAFPFSRGSSQPRDWTQVSCTAGENLIYSYIKKIKYLGINLIKKVKELYSENYDTDEKNWKQQK